MSWSVADLMKTTHSVRYLSHRSKRSARAELIFFWSENFTFPPPYESPQGQKSSLASLVRFTVLVLREPLKFIFTALVFLA